MNSKPKVELDPKSAADHARQIREVIGNRSGWIYTRFISDPAFGQEMIERATGQMISVEDLKRHIPKSHSDRGHLVVFGMALAATMDAFLASHPDLIEKLHQKNLDIAAQVDKEIERIKS